jgi:hypothetical protein
VAHRLPQTSKRTGSLSEGLPADRRYSRLRCLRGIGEQDLALWLFAHCPRPCSGHYPGAQAQISIVRRPRRPRAPQRSRPKRTILSNDTTLLDLPSQRRTHIRRDRGFRSKVILPHVKAYMFLEDYAKREVRVIDPPAAFRLISRTRCSLSSCWNYTDTYISRPSDLDSGEFDSRRLHNSATSSHLSFSR